MKEIAEYLMDNYYNKYCPKHLIPESEEMLIKALNICEDKLFVVYEDGKIKGVGVFLTLSDENYNNLEAFDISDTGDLAYLLNDKGENLHFILVAGKGVKRMLMAIKKLKKEKQAKSVSWWNPSMTYLHRYNFN